MEIEDKKLLELAAKACGITVHGLADKFVVQHNYGSSGLCIANNIGGDSLWNPLINSGDCAAMCAKLDINTFWWSIGEVECISVSEYEDNYSERHDGTDAGKEATWRYAATMVAAKIGGYNGD